jgi:hypothetical protein
MRAALGYARYEVTQFYHYYYEHNDYWDTNREYHDYWDPDWWCHDDRKSKRFYDF